VRPCRPGPREDLGADVVFVAQFGGEVLESCLAPRHQGHAVPTLR
jgi:hypothetical protein